MKKAWNVVARTVAITLIAGAVSAQDRSSSRPQSIEEARDAARIAQQIAKEQAADDLKHLIESYIPLRVEVVISKYQGDKKIASAPYVLSVNANDGSPARLRMGAQVPLPVAATPKGGSDSKDFFYGGPVQYKDIGTNIDCRATGPFLDRFKLDLTIDESSVAPVDTPGLNSPPAIRSFKLSNTALLKDGQSTHFSTATDKITGEVTKIDVTLKVMK